MRFTRAFLPTLKEAPAEAEVASHRLMVRSSMIRRLAAGVYSLLPLGVRVQRKVEQICREEMNRAGAQEVLLPALNPAELWRRTERWDVYGKELIRLKDRHGRDFCLGPTHEEVVTDLVSREVRSYRDLPLQSLAASVIRPLFGSALFRRRRSGQAEIRSELRTVESAHRFVAPLQPAPLAPGAHRAFADTG